MSKEEFLALLDSINFRYRLIHETPLTLQIYMDYNGTVAPYLIYLYANVFVCKLRVFELNLDQRVNPEVLKLLLYLNQFLTVGMLSVDPSDGEVNANFNMILAESSLTESHIFQILAYGEKILDEVRGGLYKILSGQTAAEVLDGMGVRSKDDNPNDPSSADEPPEAEGKSFPPSDRFGF
jgi:hypothetical protein